MKNLKNLVILLAFACAIPVCRAEENQTIQAEQQPDRTKEYAARTKLSIAEAAMIYGALTGLVTGVATQSVLAGGAVFAVPAVIYAGLRAKYKSMFTKEQFDVVKDTEDETFIYMMAPMMVPIGVALYVYMGIAACTALTVCPALAIGGPVCAITAKLGIAKESAAFIGAGIMAAIQAAYRTRVDNVQKGDVEYKKITWAETLRDCGINFGWTAASALLVTGAALGSAGMIS